MNVRHTKEAPGFGAFGTVKRHGLHKTGDGDVGHRVDLDGNFEPAAIVEFGGHLILSVRATAMIVISLTHITG